MEEHLKKFIKVAVREVFEEMKMIDSKEEILNVKQLCEWLNVSPAWVSTNKDKRNIPYFNVGGDKFYRKDIERWIEANKIEKSSSILRAK